VFNVPNSAKYQMSSVVMTSKISSLGKKVLDDLYVHKDFLRQIVQELNFHELAEACLQLMSAQDLAFCNVIKINMQRKRLSFLQYLDFDEDPFPTLNGSWVVDPQKKSVTFRSYSNSLNPPILHRKELLVPQDHPLQQSWRATTKIAEDIGLFSTSSVIGFRENWRKLIEEKGFKLQGTSFIPIGNLIEIEAAPQSLLGQSQINRHLTALSRNNLSAPIQLLVSHGLINQDISVFDYGCGRGDDLRGLTEIGVKCGGWDPHYANDSALVSSEIVNIGFVINVIEDIGERSVAVQNAFSLAKTALVVSVMLMNSDRPGKPYLDGYLTSRNTFQKYFSQEQFKEYLKNELDHDPVMIGPGIALIFKDQDAEQRFLLNRYRSSNVARRLLTARISPRAKQRKSDDRIRVPRVSKTEREFIELRPLLDELWSLSLDLGRFPEEHEIPQISDVLEKISLTRAYRLIRTHYDMALLDKAAETRSDEIKLFIASLQVGKQEPYRQLEPKLRFDIRYFFGDFKTATNAALKLLLDSGNTENILEACKVAAADGIGWLDQEHSLQLHISMVERLPAVLRAYISCGLLLWDNISSIQLIKIHVVSGKLTLLQYEDFDIHPIPLLLKRIKVNIRKLDYDVFDYRLPHYPPSPLLFKSRYMHEDMPGYAEQAAFDESLEATQILDRFEFRPTREQVEEALEDIRFEILEGKLVRSTKIPQLDQLCGMNFSFRQLIECGETQASFGLANRPSNPATYNALHDLSKNVLDPVIDYFGSIRLTYGFCSSELASKIEERIAPKLDQHASHELNRKGAFICTRLGAAVDFIVEDEDMIEVAQWIVSNVVFDRMYLYGADQPMHISYSENPVSQITIMRKTATGRLIPRTLDVNQFLSFSLGADI
jgi:DNA phosphorothioation-associated putative methyltransferase